MKDSKVLRYLGLARRAGRLQSGANTCTHVMRRGKAALVILAEDISENGEKKIMKEIRASGVPYVNYGKIDELSQAVGQSGRSVFTITDDQFAETILKEIMREKNTRRVCE